MSFFYFKNEWQKTESSLHGTIYDDFALISKLFIATLSDYLINAACQYKQQVYLFASLDKATTRLQGSTMIKIKIQGAL